jgi:hypothetical protein
MLIVTSAAYTVSSSYNIDTPHKTYVCRRCQLAADRLDRDVEFFLAQELAQEGYPPKLEECRQDADHLGRRTYRDDRSLPQNWRLGLGDDWRCRTRDMTTDDGSLPTPSQEDHLPKLRC